MSEEYPHVSILVVNYNGKEHLGKFLESALNLSYPKNRYEIVIIDNGSSDGSVRHVREKCEEYITGKKYPLIKLIELDKNYGFAGGNNKGVKYCDGEYLALINNDTILDRDWLIELIKAALKYPNAVYGSKMLWYVNKNVIIYGGGKLLAWGAPMHMWLYKIDEDDYRTEPEKTFYVDGCGFLIPKKIFLEIGGFDESYFAYAEDYELSWKARLLGYEIYLVPTAKFNHKISATGGEFSPFHIYHLYRNHLRSIIKFTEFSTLIYMVPSYMLYGILNYLLIHLYNEKKPKLILYLLKAYIDVILDLPRLAKIRKEYQKKRKVKDKKFKEDGLIMSFKDSISETLDVIKRRKRLRG